MTELETQLLATVNEIAENMNAGKQTDVILLDIAKAFDKVPHVRLKSSRDQRPCFSVDQRFFGQQNSTSDS